jgi:O-antigen/teichoic acid export membrane protein
MKTVEPTLHREGFLRQITGTLATRLLLIGLGAISAIIIARSLTPGDRGLYAVAVTLAGLAAQLGNLGLHAAHTHALARDPDRLGAIVGNTVAVSIGGGFVLAGLTALVSVLWPAVAPLHGPALWLTLLWAPLNLGTFLFVNLLIGLGAVGVANRLELGSRLLSLTLLLGIVLQSRQSVPSLVALAAVTQAATFLTALVLVRRQAGPSLRLSLPLLGQTVRHGFSTWLTTVLTFLLIRLDLLLLHYLGTPADTGYYAVALTLADVVMVLPGTVCNLLFPRMVGSEPVAARWRYTLETTRATALVLAPLLAGMALVSGWLIETLFGAAYAPAALVLQIMAPGLFCLGLETVMVQFLNGQGLPMSISAVWAAIVAGNVGLNLWLIPRHGSIGAAWAATVSDVAALLVVGWLSHRRAHRPDNGA